MGETITDESSVTEVVKDNVPVVETMTAQPVAEAVKEVADTEKVASEPVVEVEKEESAKEPLKEEPAIESTQPEPIIESIKEEPSVESITIKDTDIIKKDVEEIVDQDKASKQLEDSELNSAALAAVAAS